VVSQSVLLERGFMATSNSQLTTRQQSHSNSRRGVNRMRKYTKPVAKKVTVGTILAVVP
jgi:hypothetical protein